MSVHLLSNVRAVTPDGIVDDATIASEDGRILAVEEHRSYVGAIDGLGAFCLPGLVDSHSDAIEHEVAPRPTAVFDLDFALGSLESRFLSAGITTVYHGVRFADDAGRMRSMEMATAIVEAVAQRRRTMPALDHRILFRVPARGPGSLDQVEAHLASSNPDGATPLVSFEDHTPGQGQFRDIERYKASFPDDRAGDLDAEIARRIEEARAQLPTRMANLARVRELAVTRRARVLAHDCVDAAEVGDACGWGAAVAEFPVTMEAARAARERGMPVVLGAPNVLLGGSHSGNVAAEEVIAAGLCSGLASDYLPPSMLAAAFDLAARKVLELHNAVHLVTAGPAEATGLTDRGTLRPGSSADLVLVTLDRRWPQVRSLLSLSRPRVEAAI